MEPPKKLLIFKKITFRGQKLKKCNLKEFLIFRSLKLSSPKLKRTSYISGGNLQSLKLRNVLYLISHVLFAERELFKHKNKRKKFLILSLIKKKNFLS